jgi:hypothetical protein
MYTLDTKLASKADAIGAYISETGKYTGTFVRAEKLVSANKQTDGIGFTFRADDGRECRFDVWTRKGNGERLSGLNQINAMMACLKLRAINVSQQNVKKWDNGQEVTVCRRRASRPDGQADRLLLRAEEYEKMADGQKTGDTGWRMGLFAIFQAETELMASEIMARKTTPEQLAKVVASWPTSRSRSRAARRARHRRRLLLAALLTTISLLNRTRRSQQWLRAENDWTLSLHDRPRAPRHGRTS